MISERNYILIKTLDENATFIENNIFYEIYYLPDNISDLIVNENSVKASSQFEAFIKLMKFHKSLLKFSHKDFYEKELRI